MNTCRRGSSAVVAVVDDQWADKVENALVKSDKRIDKAIDSGDYDELQQAISKSSDEVSGAITSYERLSSPAIASVDSQVMSSCRCGASSASGSVTGSAASYASEASCALTCETGATAGFPNESVTQHDVSTGWRASVRWQTPRRVSTCSGRRRAPPL
jgi:hypothetical protein